MCIPSNTRFNGSTRVGLRNGISISSAVLPGLTDMPSTHRQRDREIDWKCWLGGRKGIRPVKNSGGVLVWLSVLSKVQTCIWPSWCHCHSLSHASVKSRLVLPFWYRLTWVVPEKGPLNGCVCVCVPIVYQCTGCSVKMNEITCVVSMLNILVTYHVTHP